VYTQHSQNQEIKQKYFTTRQALHREKRGIKKPKEKLLKNNFQKLLAPSLSLSLSLSFCSIRPPLLPAHFIRFLSGPCLK